MRKEGNVFHVTLLCCLLGALLIVVKYKRGSHHSSEMHIIVHMEA